MNGIIFFSTKPLFIYLQLKMEKSIEKYRLSTGESRFTVSTWLKMKKTVPAILNEVKGLFSKFILVKSQRETYQEYGVKRSFKKIVINSSFS